MLDLTDGGRCMSGTDAIEFMERLADLLDEEVRTEEFCNEFTYALNRFRYEIRKSIPVPARRQKGRFTSCSCGQCGHVVVWGDKYCPECGRAIGWDVT